MRIPIPPTTLLTTLVLVPPLSAQEQAPTGDETPWVVYEPLPGQERDEQIVLLAGDEEYRSEEALPMLARILAKRHGFRSTVLFSIDPESGEIDPTVQGHVPGMELIDQADLVVVFWRFRCLPDEDMAHLVDYVAAGKPIIGLRTSTHAFKYHIHSESPYADWSFDREGGGFGVQTLGQNWVDHHGQHGRQSTRGVIEQANAMHPILTDVQDVWGPTDVYGVREMPPDAKVLLRGQVLTGMEPTDGAAPGEVNDPMMPIVWVREIEREEGPAQRVVCSTIGASQDFLSEDLRRLFVNACYWAMRLDYDMPRKVNVRLVGPYDASPFGFERFKKHVRPADLALR